MMLKMKNSISHNISITKPKFFLGLLLWLFWVSGTNGAGINSGEKLWYQANELADRLQGERWKFFVVREEIDRLRNVLKDLVAVRNYPTEITQLSEEKLKYVEESLNNIAKNSTKALNLLEELEKPQEDALSISIEMLKEAPNIDMIEILINDNLARIQDLIVVKKYVDKQWDYVEEIMGLFNEAAGIKRPKGEKGLFDDSFFKVLISQLGQASDEFYKKFHNYKDSLAAKGNIAQWENMLRLDLGSIVHRKREEDPKNIQRDLERLAQRFQGRLPIDNVYQMLAENYFEVGDYYKSLSVLNKVNVNSKEYEKSRYYTLLSLFQLNKDDSLVALYEKYKQKEYFKSNYNEETLYLAIQSYYKLNEDDKLETELLKFSSKSFIYYKAYLLYAKSLVKRKKDREANQVFKSLIKQTQLPDSIRHRASLLLGYLKYEQEYYESAISDFTTLIDKPGFGADALFGIVWCYSKLKDMKSAEFTLKKLINQFPDNPLALEGLMVLSKWKFIKAQKLWKYKTNTEKNQRRLRSYQKELDEKTENGQMDNLLADEIRRKLSIVELNLSSRVPVKDLEIMELYNEAIVLGSYAYTHYKSGEYSEISYLGTREKAIEKLISLQKNISSSNKSIGAMEEIKQKIVDTQVFNLDMHIQYMDWIEEFSKYLQQEKKFYSDNRNNLGVTASDFANIIKTNNEKRSNVLESKWNLMKSAINICQTLIEDPLNREGRDKALFYKGFILFKMEEAKVQRSFEKSKAIANVKGEKFEEQAVLYSNSEFSKVWNFLIHEYPDSKFAHVAYYYLGLAKIKQGDEIGIKVLSENNSKFSNTQFFDHSQILIGDHQFDNYEYMSALDSYLNVIDNEKSAYFDESLYMTAWSYYQAEEYEKSLKAFSFILEDQLNKATRDQDSTLLEESLKMVSFCFAEMDTSQDVSDEKVRAFVQNFSKESLGAAILHRTAIVFRKQGRLLKTKRVLSSLIKNYPQYGDIPEAKMDLAVAYDIENEFARALEIREDIFQNYNKESAWYKKLENKVYAQRADSLCEEALNKIAYHYFAEAKLGSSKNAGGQDSIVNKEAFMKAIEAYERFLKVYPDSRNSGKLYYQLAESYFAIKEFYSATIVYLKASQSKDSNIRSAASYNAIVASQKYNEQVE